ncbi:NAD-dependent epimerase/dehydratase family protein [Mycobacterium sp. pV006]|uniref:NAD-dependent epimerase/dehydratase family protein n=1 Tax=Mycobacterium sp. pV006 TaxID=3238983 RepID=UPI00351B7B59
MRIAVTGGTGYLGAHTVRALLEAGHDVKLLALPHEADSRVVAELRALGRADVLVGDVRSAETVTELLRDVDSVLHAAGVVGTSDRQAALMWEINAHATETVLTRAVEAGLDPVVSVSSYSALFPPPDGVISADTPTAPGRSAYGKTKGYADKVARRLQEAGAPVVVTYPSSVVGPPFHTDLGVTERGWAPILRAGVAPSVRGGMQMVDVRDVAEVHTRLMAPNRGPHRYVCGGQLLTFDEMIDALEAGLGRRVRRVKIAPGALRTFARFADAAGRFLPLTDGLSYEAAWLLTSATPTDDHTTTRELGITWRDPRQTIAESVRFQLAHRSGEQLGDPRT